MLFDLENVLGYLSNLQVLPGLQKSLYSRYTIFYLLQGKAWITVPLELRTVFRTGLEGLIPFHQTPPVCQVPTRQPLVYGGNE